MDELFILRPLAVHSVSTYLRIFHSTSPDNMPFYFALFYYWAHLVGSHNEAWMRVLSVLMTTACIPMTYLIGRQLFDNRTALIAAAFAALSPIHVTFAHEIRPSILVQLLALASFYFLLRALSDNKPAWWFANASTNLLALWTHPFSAFLVAAEGVCVVLSSPRRLRRIFLWGGVNSLIVLSPLLWLMPTLSSVTTSMDDFYMRIPGAVPLLADAFADDAVMISDPFFFQGVTWHFLPASLQRALVSIHGTMDALVFALFFGSTVAFLVLLVRRWKGREAGGISALQASLPIMALAPLLMLLFASLLWRPCIMPRYTSYSSYALYLIAASVLVGIADVQARRIALAGVAIVYAYQLSLALPSPAHTDWKGAVRMIAAEAANEDLVAIKGTFVALDAFKYNAGRFAQPIVPVYSEQAICDKCPRWLESHKGVWAVIEPYVFTLPSHREFEEALATRGLAFQYTFLPGMNGLYVYRIERSSQGVPRYAKHDIKPTFDPLPVLSDLRVPTEEMASALRAITYTHDTEYPCTAYFHSLVAMDLAYEGYLDLAERAATRALEIEGNYTWALYIKAIIAGEKGNAILADEEWQRLLQTDQWGYYQAMSPAFQALYVNIDLVKGQTEAARLAGQGYFMPHVMRARAGLLPKATPIS